MDPLTVFGIACNVMQVVSFSHEIFSLARRIAKDGSPDASLVEKSARLSDLSQDLQSSLKTQQLTEPLTERQQRLQKVAKKCLSCAKDLQEELDKIKWKTRPTNSNSRTHSWLPSQIWKAWWRKTKINNLQKEMTEVEQSMQSTILVDLWLCREATALQYEEGFKSLDDRLQHFIRQYAQGCMQLSALVLGQTAVIKEEVHSENAKTRHVLEQLQGQEIDRATMDECKIFLSSLCYDSMNARRSQIDESHEKTFHWIFDETISHQWESFSKWLKSDEQIYWISGKAGSGKSTLMKFLINNQRTRDALEFWKEKSTIISFFLWRGGNLLQRTVKGVLCSLLHQVLTPDQSLITRLIGVQPEVLTKKNHPDDWSIMELEQVLILAISMLAQPPCVFLDGLDEIDRDEGFHYLLDLIEKLRSKSNTKLCISSRPDPALQDAFNRYPKLLLQDLTKSDISSFVNSFLEDSNFYFWDENVVDEKKRQQIVGEVVRNAHGVFLWVHLVLKSLRRGRANYDNYEQILGRIRELPQTLEGLYKQAWDRLGDDESRYRAEAARYFRLVLEARGFEDDLFIPPFSLLDLSIASNSKIQNAFLQDKGIPPVTKLLENAMTCRRRIESCCCGLLEFWEAEDETRGNVDNLYCELLMPLSAYVTRSRSSGNAHIPHGQDLRSLWNTFYNVKVDFIHRTAIDFLVESELGRNIISSDLASASDIRAKIFHSQLIRTLLFYFPWHIRGRHTSANMFSLDKLGGNIPDEMQQGIQTAVADIYNRLLDRASVIEFIINELRVQIRYGQFEGSFYKVLCDFTSSTRAQHFPQSRPCFHTEGDATSFLKGLTKTWKTGQMVRYLPKACTQILVNYESMSTDLWRDVNWPVEIPKIEILCHASVSSDNVSDRIFAHLLFTTWILVDASRCLRYRTAEMAISFLHTILRGGLIEVAEQWFNARPGQYDGIPGFKEMLLDFPNNTPEMRDLLEKLLRSAVKAADPADQLDGPGYPSFTDDLEVYIRVNQRAIYKAVVSDFAESDDSEDDGSSFFY